MCAPHQCRDPVNDPTVRVQYGEQMVAEEVGGNNTSPHTLVVRGGVARGVGLIRCWVADECPLRFGWMILWMARKPAAAIPAAWAMMWRVKLRVL